jgi:DNA mismatch repair protein MutS
MLRQYQEIKARHPDKILFFRVGDFYEMFFDDAKEAAQILQITLTSRAGSPLAGVPYHALNHYLYKLVRAGKKVAICEQMEDPSQAKGLVRRDIVSVVTPSTVLDEGYANLSENNFLCSLWGNPKELSLAFADLATGELFVLPSAWFGQGSDRLRLLQDELVRFQPSEILHNEGLAAAPDLAREIAQFRVPVEPYPDRWFDVASSPGDEAAIAKAVPESDSAARKAVNGAFRYLLDTQGGAKEGRTVDLRAALANVRVLERRGYVEMDDFTIRNLELVKNMRDGSHDGTLLSALDRTLTPMGGRLLKNALLLPLFDLGRIRERQNAVEAFYDDSLLLENARTVLREVSDLERLGSRLALRRVIPRDLVSLANSLSRAFDLKVGVQAASALAAVADGIEPLPELPRLLLSAVEPEPPSVFEGGVIRPGFHGELDTLRSLVRDSREVIMKLQAEEREKTGIDSLKIKYNNIFGYFIEISKANSKKVPERYVRKQSLVNAERFTLPELEELESRIAVAGEKLSQLEEEIFRSLVEQAAEKLPSIQRTASSVAWIDFYAALGLAAQEGRYVKPQIHDGDEWQVEGGRHPVVERSIGHDLFVSNDTNLDADENRIIILTGPNMAGKSTWLRQNALFAVMAQAGSFIPAKSARLGLVDRIFTRIGASDDLAQGRSTFMVEMQEAANILRNVTSKSLIIMDELGRGTSTFDGLSIAWAVVEYLYERPESSGKTLFATHYHELTKLGENRGIRNLSMAVREYREDLVFLRKVIDGPADRSYGIFVAKLAGIPEAVLERAKRVLDVLETGGEDARDRVETAFRRDYRKKPAKNASEMELFAEANPGKAVAERVMNLDIDKMTPLEALTFLAELKKQIRN